MTELTSVSTTLSPLVTAEQIAERWGVHRDVWTFDIGQVSQEELPDLIGRLAKLQAQATARLHTLRLSRPPETHDVPLEQTLTADEVAALFKVSERWVRNHRNELGGFGTRKMLRFPERAVRDWMQTSRKDSCGSA